MMSGLTAQQRNRVVIWGSAVFLVGFVVRLVLVLKTYPHELSVSEPVNIALSLVRTGKYADAYGAGVGPTAHSAPLHPLFLSVLFRIFGTGAIGSLAMEISAIIAISLSFALLPSLAVASELGLNSGVLAGFAGALLPVNFWSQTSGTFDQPFTSALLVALCILLCRVWGAASFTKAEGAVFGVVAGIGCLLNPCLIQVLVAWAIVTAFRFRQQLRQVLWFCAVSGLCVVLILAPWAIRNYVALGSLIWTRSNFGMELQHSNNDMFTADLEYNVRMAEWLRVNPFTSESEQAKVRMSGEVAYQRAEQQEAFAWIRTHKRRFLVLTAERVRLFWLPRMQRPWQTLFETCLTITALCGLIVALWKRNTYAWILSAVLISYPSVYYLIEMSPRFRLPIESILFLFSAYAVWSLFAHFRETLQFRR